MSKLSRKLTKTQIFLDAVVRAKPGNVQDLESVERAIQDALTDKSETFDINKSFPVRAMGGAQITILKYVLDKESAAKEKSSEKDNSALVNLLLKYGARSEAGLVVNPDHVMIEEVVSSATAPASALKGGAIGKSVDSSVKGKKGDPVTSSACVIL